ncbi:MAG: hypothetical protein GY887_13865, partial [Halieaceae bacterium]|nr:hypothetical protein [Halieaceae bacterium]
LYVGYFGNGTLNVEAGGLVSNNQGYIGFNSEGTGVVTVSGSGSQWNNSGRFYVGFSGNGTLNVEAGGLVSNTDGYIGRFTGSTGVATVSGSGSQWNNSRSLYVGGDSLGAGGSGSLTIADSGLVDVAGTTKLWNAGMLALDGGSLTTGSFDNTAGGTFNFNTGTLRITDVGQALSIGTSSFSFTNGTSFNTSAGTTTLAANQNLEIAGAATVENNATLTMAGGSLTSGSFTNNGMVHTTSGTSTIAGDVQNNGGFQVDTGSGLLFLDDLSGDGPFTGGG